MHELFTAVLALGLDEGHLVQQRPWGAWIDWYREPRAVLKCIAVKPGHRTSLQRHAQRAEVWRVLSGTGENQATHPATPLTPGQTHRIEAGQMHRIANTGPVPLIIVEMQFGICHEDDIERLADDYDRDGHD